MTLSDSRHPINVDFKLASITSINCSLFIRIAKPSLVIPALFTRYASSPSAATILFIADTNASSSLTSKPITSAFPPAASISALTAFASASPERKFTHTFKPKAAKPFAISAPIPLLAPVTNTLFPENFIHHILKC